MITTINSLEELIIALARNIQSNAQIKGIPPRETLRLFDIELPERVPNSWDAVDLVSHCNPITQEMLSDD